MNITITGNLGAGKSSVCAYLKQQGFEVISTGNILREIAEKRGLSILEMNEAAKTDSSIDSFIDSRSVELGKEKDHAVFDSRMAWYFIPNSFKVFLFVDTNEAARRVLADHTRKTEKYTTIEETAEKLQERAFLEKNRFQELYGVNYFAIHNYNLVVDSTDVSPEQAARKILENFEAFQKDPFIGKIESSDISRLDCLSTK